LLIVLLYTTFASTASGDDEDEHVSKLQSNKPDTLLSCVLTTSAVKKTVLGVVAILSIVFLPFSVYVVSPGAHVFACLVLINMLLAFFVQPNHALQISIGEKSNSNNNSNNNSLDGSWFLTREETLACVCNLGSSLYNYAGSIRTWPHWKRYFYQLDAYMEWPDEGDCTVNKDFTMGLDGVHMPLFVSRASGSMTGAQVFWLVWSVLPFLYVSYFFVMFLLAKKSPGTIVQRILCTYGMLHFLFGTDVVAYRYGRGYHSYRGASEFFHWVEKGAWRIAILMPIYQNCTNGHWSHGHTRFPILGKILRIVAMCWGVWFLCFQVIQSDVFKFSQYLMDEHQHGLIDILGLNHHPLLKYWTYPYRFALVTMFVTYGLLHVTGFTLFRITIQTQGHSAIDMSRNGEDVALLLADDDTVVEEEDDEHGLI